MVCLWKSVCIFVMYFKPSFKVSFYVFISLDIDQTFSLSSDELMHFLLYQNDGVGSDPLSH